MSKLENFRSAYMWKRLVLIIVLLAISACATYQPEVEEAKARYYIVRQHDNFHSIAFTFEITTEQLQLANPWLSSSNISPGMRLTIPNAIVDNQISIPAQDSVFIWPLRVLDVSSNFGYRRGSLHAGVDLRAPRGTAIYASAAGRIVFSGRQKGYGLMLLIDHGGGIETAYAHNDRNIVELGQHVKQGQMIARVGRSGNANGYHVHFEIRRMGKPVNPVGFVNAGL